MKLSENHLTAEQQYPRNLHPVHQPVVICIDTSSSMDEKSEDGRTKAQVVESMVNKFADIDLPESDKHCVDICILGFDDDCRVLVDWRPLSSFHGGVKLTTGRQCVLSSAVISSIDKIRERRVHYNTVGIEFKLPQIFLYTDGKSTENLTKAYQYSIRHLNHHFVAKMYIVKFPPITDFVNFTDFGEKVSIINVNDCSNGLPPGFQFMQDDFIKSGLPQKECHTSIPADLLKTVVTQDDKNDIGKDDDIWDSEISQKHLLSEQPIALMSPHVPVVICIDILEEKHLIQVAEGLKQFMNIGLTETEKRTVDICILLFDSEWRVLMDWQPLSNFNGNLHLALAGSIALESAVLIANNKIRERRKLYNELGIESYWGQVFVYTDGGNKKDLTAACNCSLSRSKTYITLISPLFIELNDSILEILGENTTILSADEYTVKESFEFMENIVASWFVAYIKDDVINVCISSWLSVYSKPSNAKWISYYMRAWDEDCGWKQWEEWEFYFPDFQFKSLKNNNFNLGGIPIMETPRNYLTPEQPRNLNTAHQPVVICIDTSGSMNDPSEDGRSKAQIVEGLINQLADIDLPESDKQAVDICILVFDDDCRVLVDWRPLSSFTGGISLDIAGRTALGSAVLMAIDKTRERRKHYDDVGIESKRAQIFVYTDGESTEDLTAAYQRSMSYLNRDYPSAKMYITLIPPAKDPRELTGFGQKVAIMAAKDCVNGLPSAFQFMQGSIVAWSQSTPGKNTQTSIPSNLNVLPGHGNAKRTESGEKAFEEDDIWKWEDET